MVSPACQPSLTQRPRRKVRRWCHRFCISSFQWWGWRWGLSAQPWRWLWKNLPKKWPSKKTNSFFQQFIFRFHIKNILKTTDLHPSLFSLLLSSDFCCCCWKAFANAAMGLKFLSRRFNKKHRLNRSHGTPFHQTSHHLATMMPGLSMLQPSQFPEFLVKLRTGVGLLLKHLSWRSHVWIFWMMGVLPKVYFYRSIMRLSSGRLKTNINSARPLASDNCSCKIPIPAAIILNICLRLALHFLGCPMPRRLRIYSNETLHVWFGWFSSCVWHIVLRYCIAKFRGHFHKK